MMVTTPDPVRKKKSPLRRLLQCAASVTVLLCIGLLLYCITLSAGISDRFSGRRWRIPSTVFSDTTPLYPGQRINRRLLDQKLQHLGYRKINRPPDQKGLRYQTRSSIDLYLTDRTTPSGFRKGFPVRITFAADRITAIKNSATGKPLAVLELEPEEIALFFGPERERRRLIALEQMPQHLIHAVLAAEDLRFYHHMGVDPRGILRAVVTNLKHGTIRQGGSTITQQLAKNYFLTPDRSFARKLKELFMALTIEQMYTKNEILEIYLNEIYLGQNGSVAINGIGEAALFYFGKSAADLSPAQAAAIAGLIKGPNLYSPYVDPQRCRKRRNRVLQVMHENDWLSANALEAALATPVQPAGYQPHGLRAPYFIDYLSDQLGALYPPEALASLGLSIHTTLDTQVQAAAETALENGLTRLEAARPDLHRSDPAEKLQGAILVMQPKTGHILAMVGGRRYAESQFNRITQARRQPGSAFKPFVYLTALDRFTPVTRLSNAPKGYRVNGTLWQPRNYAPLPEKEVTLRTALARSVNLATVDLALQVGLDPIVETAGRFGFSTPLPAYPSLSLGAAEVIPLELARAYCPFAADGLLPYPLAAKDVLDETGQVLSRKHMTIERVTSPAKAFMMSSLLRSVVETGTARSLKSMGIAFPVAGKTGTTSNYRDAWFVGYTPDLLALVWVGFDDGSPMHASGAGAALPIWAELVRALPRYVSGTWLTMPPGVVAKTVCGASGQLARSGRCPDPHQEFFLTGTAPDTVCRIHGSGNPLQKIINLFRGKK